MSDAIEPAPAPAPQPQAPPATTTAQTTTSPSAPAVPTTTEEPQTLNTKLNAIDRYWKFKLAIQIAAILTGLIGIGTIAWTTSTRVLTFYFDYDGYYSQWPGIIPFIVSVLWCSLCILFLLVGKKPVHPGFRVTLDLLLWLSFIFTAMFAMFALFELTSWGADGTLGYAYSSSGGYELASNGTWVWYRTEGSSSYGTQPRDCNGTTYLSGYGYGDAGLKSCADLDAYVNALWQEKPHRVSVVLTSVVCQFFGIVLHFALFVWACVDCHLHRRNRNNKDAEKIAAEIVQKMIANGAIVPPPGQAQVTVRPMAWAQPGYYQLPQQNGAPPMASPIAGPVSNGKSEGPRYA